MDIMPFKPKDIWSEPFHSLENLGNEMNRFFNSLSRRMVFGRGLFEREWGPDIDVYDSKDEIQVKVDLPGMKKDEIDVSIQADTLTIKGEKKKESEIREENFIRAERFCGKFNRTITLPSTIDKEKISASYKDGVLELRLPKREEAKASQISIEIK